MSNWTQRLLHEAYRSIVLIVLRSGIYECPHLLSTSVCVCMTVNALFMLKYELNQPIEKLNDMLPCSRQCGLNIVIVPWQVGMQPPMEGTPMPLNPCIEDHFVTMAMHSTLFTSLTEEHTGSFRKIQLAAEWATCLNSESCFSVKKCWKNTANGLSQLPRVPSLQHAVYLQWKKGQPNFWFFFYHLVMWHRQLLKLRLCWQFGDVLNLILFYLNCSVMCLFVSLCIFFFVFNWSSRETSKSFYWCLDYYCSQRGKKWKKLTRKTLNPSLAVGRSSCRNNACESSDQNLPYVAL